MAKRHSHEYMLAWNKGSRHDAPWYMYAFVALLVGECLLCQLCSKAPCDCFTSYKWQSCKCKGNVVWLDIGQDLLQCYRLLPSGKSCVVYKAA